MRPLLLRRGWIVINREGGTQFHTFARTRKAAVNKRTDEIGTWDFCSKHGDVVVKVSLFAGHFKR